MEGWGINLLWRDIVRPAILVGKYRLYPRIPCLQAWGVCQTQYFSAKFVLTDKDGKTIFERIDKREDEKKAYDMFNRAVKDFYKDVNSLK